MGKLKKKIVSVKEIGIKIDLQLNFTEHLNGIIRKVSLKVNVLSEITLYMDMNKKRILTNSFLSSQFSYCPSVWMFHSRTTDNKINRLHERCLRVIYNDKRHPLKTC